VLLREATDGDFLGVNGASKGGFVNVAFFWALSGEKLLNCSVRESSTLSDIAWRLQHLMPGDGGLLRLTTPGFVYSEAGSGWGCSC